MILAEEHNVILPAWPDLIWGSICFVIIVIAVAKFAWPAFSRILDERREKIEDGLTAAERAQEQVAAERAKIAGEQEAAQREAAEIRQRAHTNADEIIARAQEDAQREADRINAAAQSRIKADTEAAARVLRADVGDLATRLANRIVGEQVRLDPKVNEGVVDAFLDELESATPAGGQGA